MRGVGIPRHRMRVVLARWVRPSARGRLLKGLMNVPSGTPTLIKACESLAALSATHDNFFLSIPRHRAT